MAGLPMLMNTLSLAIALLLQAQAAPQEPQRVVPGGSPAGRPVYRELKPGEERVEGVLQRVEYIAHTPDFQSPMSCGGRGKGDPVFLTWKTVGKEARAVAVEFLPRGEGGK